MQQDFDPRDLEPALYSAEVKERRWLPAVIALIALGGFSAIVWYAYNQGANSVNTDPLPVVHAEPGPLKTRPADPGGMEVPNQDKLILNGQAIDVGTGKVERLLPPPETPLAKPSSPSALATLPPSSPPSPPQAAITTPPAAGGQAGGQSAPRPQPVISRAAPVPAPTAASTHRGAKVQLGAVKSEAAATAEWTKLQKTHPELASLSMSLAKVEIPNKGVYYRIQAGPATDPAAICATLKARGQDCLIVR